MTTTSVPTGYDTRERVAAWLTANGINPDQVPLHSNIDITTRPDGTRVIRHEIVVPGSGGMIREQRETPLTAEFDGDTEKQSASPLNAAYRERAHLVALLAVYYPAVLAPAPDVAEPGWQIVYVASPSGQLSWHIAPADADLFQHVPRVTAGHPQAQWDGHTTEQKYDRIRHLVAMNTEGRP